MCSEKTVCMLWWGKVGLDVYHSTRSHFYGIKFRISGLVVIHNKLILRVFILDLAPAFALYCYCEQHGSSSIVHLRNLRKETVKHVSVRESVGSEGETKGPSSASPNRREPRHGAL